jgi:hypothetical protein
MGSIEEVRFLKPHLKFVQTSTNLTFLALYLLLAFTAFAWRVSCDTYIYKHHSSMFSRLNLNHLPHKTVYLIKVVRRVGRAFEVDITILSELSWDISV